MDALLETGASQAVSNPCPNQASKTTANPHKGQLAIGVSLRLVCCRYLSIRGKMWTDVDNQRAGGLPFVFEPGMGFDRYVDWALDVPMLFVYRQVS